VRVMRNPDKLVALQPENRLSVTMRQLDQ